MTTLNILLLIGSLYFFIGLGIVFNSKYYWKIFDEILESKASMFYGWIAAFIIWFVILLFFNDFWFSKDWLVAIIWLISLIKWIFLLFCPKALVSLTKLLLNKKYINFIWFLILLMWVLILYTVYKV